jgi:hypothetical protein
VATHERRTGGDDDDAGTRTAGEAGGEGVGTVVVDVVGAIALAVGVGTGYVPFGGSDSRAVPQEVEQLVGDYYDAWNAQDAAVIRALATDDAVLYGRSVDETGAMSLENVLPRLGESTIRIDDIMVAGEGPDYEVVVVLSTESTDGTGSETLSYLRLREEDGTLEVALDRALDTAGLRPPQGIADAAGCFSAAQALTDSVALVGSGSGITGQESWPRSRDRSAHASRTTPPTASSGWTGANHCSAPV